MMEPSSDAPLPRLFAGGVLRRLQASDLAFFQAYRAIPEVGRFQGWAPMPDGEAVAFLREMHTMPLFAPGKWLQLGIAEPGTNRLVGDIGVFLAEDERWAEIGFTLAPAAQGRGIATAAVREVIRLVFSLSPVEQVRAVTDIRNTASIRLLERAGFAHQITVSASFRGEPCLEATYVLPRAVSA